MYKNSCLIFLLQLLTFELHSQDGSVKEHIVSADGVISWEKLTGRWETPDSLKNEVYFEQANQQVTLHLHTNQLYYFSMDSLNQVGVSGYFPLWPPLDCTLNLLSADTLEISCGQIGVTFEKLLYVRRKH